MVEMMSALLGAPNERIWPGLGALPHAAKYRSLRHAQQPYNYLRKVCVWVGWGTHAAELAQPCVGERERADARGDPAAASGGTGGICRGCPAEHHPASPIPTRTPQEFPGLSDAGLDLLNRLLTYDPDRRITARQALRHPYFTGAVVRGGARCRMCIGVQTGFGLERAAHALSLGPEPSMTPTPCRWARGHR